MISCASFTVTAAIRQLSCLTGLGDIPKMKIGTRGCTSRIASNTGLNSAVSPRAGICPAMTLVALAVSLATETRSHRVQDPISSQVVRCARDRIGEPAFFDHLGGWLYCQAPLTSAPDHRFKVPWAFAFTKQIQKAHASPAWTVSVSFYT